MKKGFWFFDIGVSIVSFVFAASITILALNEHNQREHWDGVTTNKFANYDDFNGFLDKQGKKTGTSIVTFNPSALENDSHKLEDMAFYVKGFDECKNRTDKDHNDIETGHTFCALSAIGYFFSVKNITDSSSFNVNVSVACEFVSSDRNVFGWVEKEGHMRLKNQTAYAFQVDFTGNSKEKEYFKNVVLDYVVANYK